MIASSMTAAIQNQTANFVRNNRGIPTTAIPIMLSKEIIPMQTLWQICQEPKILAVPLIVPVAPMIFSCFFAFIFLAPYVIVSIGLFQLLTQLFLNINFLLFTSFLAAVHYLFNYCRKFSHNFIFAVRHLFHFFWLN